MRLVITTALLLGAAIPASGSAQPTSVTIPGTETRGLHSDVLDHDLELYVKLPWSYRDGDERYPVLFCLDGNRSFPLWSTMSLILETPGAEVEEIVIVGIGYRVAGDRLLGLADWAAWRTRDLTPARRPSLEAFWEERLAVVPGREDVDVETGGAARFLEAIETEVIPFVESEYRVRSTDRGLAGVSYGGLFSLYALFHSRGTFDRYFAGSPTMWEELFRYEAVYASEHENLPAKLFMTASGREPQAAIAGMRRMADGLEGRGYPDLELDTYVFEEETHASGYAAAVSRALRVLYYDGTSPR